MKQPDYAELGDSPAAQRLYKELQQYPQVRKRVFCSLQKWTTMLHSVRGLPNEATLFKLIRVAFGEMVEKDMAVPPEMKIGIRSIFCTRYKKMLKTAPPTTKCKVCEQTKNLLSNPLTVEVNMKHGTIALPPWKRMCAIYGKQDEWRRAHERGE